MNGCWSRRELAAMVRYSECYYAETPAGIIRNHAIEYSITIVSIALMIAAWAVSLAPITAAHSRPAFGSRYYAAHLLGRAWL